ncbi:unnamed protein product [Cylicostephanus goldi]|uniref:Methyltransferase domain-containing protein n=1 Tax=Cylicostephanus goldi TaxID=71465 RepID=A0A3P7QBW5_CYLGO|nr:unnamed protein product [Cylicostephanus goldi]
MRPYDKLCEVIKKDGPNGLDYSDYTINVYKQIAKCSEAMHKEHLVPDFVPALGSDIKYKLEEGIEVLDVGCGNGLHSTILAQEFPKSHFIGIDFTEDAIDLAKEQRRANGEKIDNLTFLQMDGTKMDTEWTNKFDLVIVFDACHDQTRPDLVSSRLQFFFLAISFSR